MPKPADESTWPYMFCDDMKFIQKVVVKHPRGERFFLALKRSEGEYNRPGDWDLPGGNVLYGESTQESIRREVTEETGLEVGEFSAITVESEYNDDTEMYILKICYVTKALRSEVTISDEHTDFEWMDKDEFDEKCKTDYLKRAVSKVYTNNRE